MTKVLIDREVVELAVADIRNGAQQLEIVLGITEMRQARRDSLGTIVAGMVAVVASLEAAMLEAATPQVSLVSYAALLNPSDVCNACWGTYGPAIHEQPLEPGEPPCECPCHSIKQREVTA
jgi:hypothetical protein